MNVSPECIKLMHYFESCKLEAYPDPGSKDGKPWTIGWGHTGPEVVKGLRWTQERADAVFVDDVAIRERGVAKLLKVGVTQAQFDALVAFAYNVGVAAFAASTLLRKVNAQDFIGAADEFKRWNKNDGKEMRGLTRRRAAERALFVGTDADHAIRIGVAAA